MVLRGSVISSEGMVDISKPAYAQKIKTKAVPKFAKPKGEKGAKFAAAEAGLKAIQVIPATAKKISGASLAIVSTSLVLPAALTPTMLVKARNVMNSAFTRISNGKPRLGKKNSRYCSFRW